MSEEPTDPENPPGADGPQRPERDRPRLPYRNRIAVLPGDPPVAYRPARVLVDQETLDSPAVAAAIDPDVVTVTPVFVAPDGADRPDRPDAPAELPSFGQWYRLDGVADPPKLVERLDAVGLTAHLDVVYFANGGDGACDCGCGCPPHPALAAEMAADPWRANPWRANPWRANPWRANPWRANAEQLNLLATGKAPTSSVMPAAEPSVELSPVHPPGKPSNGITVGVLDSGLAGGWTNASGMRPTLLGLLPPELARISGPADPPSQPVNGHPADNYLDPVAGHGTFIAGIVEQITPGCAIRVESVFEPEGDVAVSELAAGLWWLMHTVEPDIVNLSFGGTGRAPVFEWLIDEYREHRGVVFVAAAGNEGSCVPQYPAALDSVIGVAGLGPEGPAEWSNYGGWVDACAPGTDLVSAFYAAFDGDAPRINGIDSDDFTQWATWTGTSFAAPVVVAALAGEMLRAGVTANEAVERLIRAPHLARLPEMGTIVNR